MSWKLADFLEEAEGRALDRILELDLDWRPLRLESGRLRAVERRDLSPACGPFHRLRSWRAGRGLGPGTASYRELGRKLRRDPRNDRARLDRARLLLVWGRAQEAYFELSALNRRSQDPVVLLRTAEAALAVGDVGRARALLDRLVAVNSRDAWAWAWRSEARRASGDGPGARADIDEALRLSFDNVALLVLSARLGRPEDLDRALAIEPECFWALAHRGWARLARDPAEAVKDFSRMAELWPRCAWAFYWRALARDESGDSAGALRDRERAIFLDPAAIWSYSPLAKRIGIVTDWDAVLAACEASLTENPEDAAAYALRAECRDQHVLVMADLERAVRLDPARPWIRALLARMLAYRGEGRRALEEIDSAASLWPRCAWLSSWRGDILERLGDSRSAGRAHSQALRLDGEDARAYARRGRLADLDASLELDTEYASWALVGRSRALWKRGDKASALEDLVQAARRDPRIGFQEIAARRGGRGALSWSWKGELLLRSERQAEAIEVLNRAIRLDRGFALAFLWRAEARAAFGDWQRACSDASEALKRDPWLAAAYYLRAECLRRRGRLGAAAEDLELGKALSAKDWGASLARAALLRRAGRFQEVLTLCDRVLRANPLDDWAFQERALCRLALGDAAGAYRDQKEAERHETGRPWILGLPERPLRLEADRRSWARAELTDALKRGPHPAFLAWRGFLYMSSGLEAEAEKDLREALGLEEAYLSAAGWLGELLIRRGRLEEAVLLLQRCQRRRPERSQAGWSRVLALRGEIFVRRGRSEEAREAFDAALAADSEETLARLGRARLLEAEGRREAALADLDEVLPWEPRAAWLHQWRARLLAFLGRREQAEREVLRALEIHPGYEEALKLAEELRAPDCPKTAAPAGR